MAYTPRFLAIWLSILTFMTLTTAHNIQLRAHSHECFHENLHIDDKMTVTYQVGDREFGGSGNLEIDFYVCLTPLKPLAPTRLAPELHPLTNFCNIDPHTRPIPPNIRTLSQQRRPHIPGQARRKTHLLLRQQRLVVHLQRSLLQRARHSVRARERHARGPSRARSQENERSARAGQG